MSISSIPISGQLPSSRESGVSRSMTTSAFRGIKPEALIPDCQNPRQDLVVPGLRRLRVDFFPEFLLDGIKQICRVALGN